MVTKRLARFNVVAAFADMDAPKAALDRLRAEGIPPEEMSLLGPEHEMRPGDEEPKRTEATGTSGIASTTAIGAGGGGAAGGVVGALAALGVAAVPGVGIAAGAAALYGAIAGASTGGIAGGLFGAQSSARKSMMWEQTLNPLITRVEQGAVLVGVHSEEEATVASAQDALEGLGTAVEPIARLDADESFEPPGDLAAIAGQTIPSGHPERAGGAVEPHDDPDAKTIGIHERGGGPTSGRDEAAEREKRVPDPDDVGDDDEER
jgi:hypothetical protein